LPIISLETHTHAFVDAGGFVHAVGNVLIDSKDDTITNVLSGELGLGTSIGIGVGAAASVTLITKDTQAFIGQNAEVHADGLTVDTITVKQGRVPYQFDAVANVDLGADTINVGSPGLVTGDEVIYRNGGGNDIGNLSDGHHYFVRVDPLNPSLVKLYDNQSDALFDMNHIDLTSGGSGSSQTLSPERLGAFPIEFIHGLGVQARSTEVIFSVATGESGGAGLAFTGSLGFDLPRSHTSAFIDNGATVTAQNVNVSASNDLRTFGLAANLQLNIGTGVFGLA